LAIKGYISGNPGLLRKYSHDTSLFEVRPTVIVEPKDSEDVMEVVKYVIDHKKDMPELSITARSGGTCMAGGAIGESIIMAFARFMDDLGEVENHTLVAQPGAYFREFDRKTSKKNLMLPTYPASREIAAIGGMVNNNAGGEKSLIYGKTEDYTRSLKVVLSDGKEYEFRPLNKIELDRKMKQKDFEGKIYKEMFKLVNGHYEEIKKAKPKVTKNSTGYKIWDVYDRDSGIFDLTQIFVGSQGTLGILTEAELGLVEVKPKAGMLVGYVESLEHLGTITNKVNAHKPSSFETFDDVTFKFAFKFFPSFFPTLGLWRFIKLAISLIPDAAKLIYGIPKLLVMIEFEGTDTKEIEKQIDAVKDSLKDENIHWAKAPTKRASEKYWLMRRESFNLLRKNVKGNVHTAPYIDDLVVPPEKLPEFLPELNKLIKKYDLLSTVAGHMGDGNFHVIPLMDLSDEKERAKIEPGLKDMIKLVKKYNGVISGEHNDGLIRSPFLKEVYGKKIFGYFKEVKEIFDPDNIFNPHKKTDADWEYSKSKIRSHF